MEKSISNTEIIANELLLEKYQPILVIKLMRIPPMNELQQFVEQISENFGYKTLVLPGELETTVEIVSVCNSEVKELETIQKEVFDLLDRLENEEVEDIPYKTAQEIVDKNKSE